RGALGGGFRLVFERPLDGGDVVAGNLDLLAREGPVPGPHHPVAAPFLVDPRDSGPQLDDVDVGVHGKAQVENLDGSRQGSPPFRSIRSYRPRRGGSSGEEPAKLGEDLSRFLQEREVPAAGDRREPGVRDRSRHRLGGGGSDDLVLLAPDDYGAG